MRIQIILLAFAVIIAATSCQGEKKELITQKIQYDVNIKSPDPDYDWWIQNLPGPQRENLVDLIMDRALSGEIQAYDYFNNPITASDIAKIMSDTAALTLMSEEPPYEYYDTLVVFRIERESIQRIRFLEEWWIDQKTLAFEKKILGLAPVARRVDDAGNERWQPLFWIYVDNEFVKTLNK